MTNSSYYNSLSNYHTFITKSYGVDSNVLPAENIFSYLTQENLILYSNLDSINASNTTEDDLMTKIIFNDYLLNNKISQSDLEKLLNITAKYKIGDFSYCLNNNITYYDYNLRKIDKNNTVDLCDFDISYYASQQTIKYLFLLDILFQLYDHLKNINVSKEDKYNNFKYGIKFVLRYYKDTNNIWKYNSNNIIIVLKDITTITDITTSNNIIKNINNKPQDADLNSINDMFISIKNTFIKHINFIKNNDTIQHVNFANYYKICRLMYNNVLLAQINNLLIKNSLDSTTTTTSDDIIYNPSNSDLSSYNKILKLSNTLASTGYYKVLSNNGVYNIDTTYYDTSISLLNSILDCNNYNINNRFIYIPSIGNTSTLINKPKIYDFKYVNDLKINFNTDSSIKEIINVKPNTTYYIKLDNFTTFDDNIINNQTYLSQNHLYTETTGVALWDNIKKILIFKTGLTDTIYTTLFITTKIYLINITNTPQNIIQLYGNPTLPENKVISFINYKKNNAANNLNIDIYSVNNNINVSYIKTSEEIIESDSSEPIILKFVPNNLYVVKTADYNIIKGSTAYITNNTSSDYAYYISGTDNFVTVKALTKSEILYENNTTIQNALNTLNLNFNITNAKINPVSFEKGTVTSLITNNNAVFNQVKTALNTKISNIKNNANVVTDDIIKTMYSINDHNSNINKTGSSIKQSYNDYQTKTKKLVSSNYIEILCIIIFTIAIIGNLFIYLVNDKSITYPMSIFIFIIVLFTFLYINLLYFQTRFEKFDVTELPDTYPNYIYVNDFNTMLGYLNLIMTNTRNGIAQEILQPKIKKEDKIFKNKEEEFKKYKVISYNDADIVNITYKKNLSTISLIINIALIISIATILNLTYPQYTTVVLVLSLILILLAIFVYYYYSMLHVRTSSNKSYWVKPSTNTLNNLL